MLVDVFNNVTYDWYGGQSFNNGGSDKVNFVQNSAEQGRKSNDYSYEITYSNLINPPAPLLYVQGNIGSTRLSQKEDDWHVGVEWRNIPLSQEYRANVPWTVPQVTTAEMSYHYALQILDSIVAVLVNGEQKSGYYKVEWNAGG